MSEVHLIPQVAQQRIGSAKVLLESELVNGRHLPHYYSEKAVRGIMGSAAQDTFDPDFDTKITDVMVAESNIVEHLKAYHDQVWEGDKDGHEFNPVESARLAWRIHGDFLNEIKHSEKVLDGEKQSFQNILFHASRHQGFPLSQEQIYERLRNVGIGFEHTYNDHGTTGNYIIPFSHALISYTKDQEAMQDSIKHELFHGVSSQRYIDEVTEYLGVKNNVNFTKLGLEHTASESGRWMNEALTQILSQLFGDSRIFFVQFDHPTATMGQIANGVIPEILGLNDEIAAEDDRYAYTDEKIAFLNAFADIPFKLLVDAYFIQDKDDPENQVYAGAQAEKELWREIRRRGGVERIKQFREINAAFLAGDSEEARSLALTMKQQNASRRATLKRGVYGRQVARNTRKVQRGIQQARTALDKAA